MPPLRPAKGITLIEMTIATVLLSVLLIIATPSLAEFLDTQRIKSATETLYMHLVYAKSEAIKRNTHVRVYFKASNGGTTWCYGLSGNSSCDCFVPNSCQLGGAERVLKSDSYQGIVLEPHISSPGDHFTFGSMGWNMDGTFGHIRLSSSQGKQSRVIVSRMARIRVCSPAGSTSITGYSTLC
jgi:Tfp pilus assembly protein FimT